MDLISARVESVLVEIIFNSETGSTILRDLVYLPIRRMIPRGRRARSLEREWIQRLRLGWAIRSSAPSALRAPRVYMMEFWKEKATFFNNRKNSIIRAGENFMNLFWLTETCYFLFFVRSGAVQIDWAWAVQAKIIFFSLTCVSKHVPQNFIVTLTNF